MGFGTTVGRAIAGNDSGNFYLGSVWHSAGQGGQFLEVFLGHAATLTSLRLAGRSDDGSERDLYDVTIFNGADEVLVFGQFDARGASHDAIANFDAPRDPGAVPEPSTWAMMILGFGAAGAAIRSRRRTALAL